MAGETVLGRGLVLRAYAFDFGFTITRSRSGGYDERKLEQTSKPANPRRQTAFYENTRRQIAFPGLMNYRNNLLD